MVTTGEQITAANAVATAAEAKLVTYADKAVLAAQGYSLPGAQREVTAPAVDAPPFDPSVHLGAQFKSDFDAQWADLEVWVQGLLNGWMADFYPTLNPLLITTEDNWLINVVTNGYDGIPPALEQLIWDRARAKDTIEAMRMEEEANMQFAARGFSMPPGVLANRVLQVQQEAANKSSTIARDMAIKQIETAIDMTKLAIGEITKLRLGLAQALADFMRAVMMLPKAAADIAKAKAEMERMLWQSSADYIRAQVEIARLSLDAQKANQSTHQNFTGMDVNAWNESLGRQVGAALNAATQMGNVATGARSAQNTLVGSIESMQTISQGA